MSSDIVFCRCVWIIVTWPNSWFIHYFLSFQVLQWSPWFLSPPQYMDLVPGVLPFPAIDEMLLVGTQKSAETICFQLHPKHNGEDGSYPWQACGNYWRTSKVELVSNFVIVFVVLVMFFCGLPLIDIYLLDYYEWRYWHLALHEYEIVFVYQHSIRC